MRQRRKSFGFKLAAIHDLPRRSSNAADGHLVLTDLELDVVLRAGFQFATYTSKADRSREYAGVCHCEGDGELRAFCHRDHRKLIVCHFESSIRCAQIAPGVVGNVQIARSIHTADFYFCNRLVADFSSKGRYDHQLGKGVGHTERHAAGSEIRRRCHEPVGLIGCVHGNDAASSVRCVRRASEDLLRGACSLIEHGAVTRPTRAVVRPLNVVGIVLCFRAAGDEYAHCGRVIRFALEWGSAGTAAEKAIALHVGACDVKLCGAHRGCDVPYNARHAKHESKKGSRDFEAFGFNYIQHIMYISFRAAKFTPPILNYEFRIQNSELFYLIHNS